MSSDVEVTDFAGYCPIDHEHMVDYGALIVCPKGDYKANAGEWDATWAAFDIEIDDVDQLLQDLIDLNLVTATKLPDDHPLKEKHS